MSCQTGEQKIICLCGEHCRENSLSDRIPLNDRGFNMKFMLNKHIPNYLNKRGRAATSVGILKGASHL